MKAIYKYELPPCRETKIEMPMWSRPLSAAFQDDKLFVWAYVDTSAEMETRLFRVLGTGWDLGDSPGAFINTVFIDGLVFHVFDGGVTDAKTHS